MESAESTQLRGDRFDGHSAADEDHSTVKTMNTSQWRAVAA
jgi:hypothetical protein